MTTRRGFLGALGLAAASLTMTRGFAIAKPSSATTASGTGKKVLVVIFQRGAVDALSMIPPYADPRYHTLRPTIAIAKPGSSKGASIKLDDTFALHPALAPLAPRFSEGSLAIVHAVGSPDATRSHFDAQDFVESGTPGTKSTEGGFLGRALPSGKKTQLARAIAMQPNLPRMLRGTNALAMASLADFRVHGGGEAANDFESLYSGAVDTALRGAASDAFSAMKTLERVRKDAPKPMRGAKYPASPLGNRLREIAQLVRADVGVEIAVTDQGGWDTHANQRAALEKRLDDFGKSLSAFALDLEDRLNDVCLVTVTEFGRTVRENGTGGTDHGHGSAMLVMGGKVRGKKVHGTWKGLADADLFEKRDLPVTTDHRDVFAEILRTHLGVTDLSLVFPGYAPRKIGLF